MAERDAAQEEVDQLASDWQAATELAERLTAEHRDADRSFKSDAAKLSEKQDKFIEELLEGHEQDRAALGRQRDEAKALADAVAQQLAETKQEVDRYVAALAEERQRAAQIAGEREAEAQKADRLAEEREASTREAAKVAAEQDVFLAELLEGHDRAIAAAKRERDFAKQQGKAATRELAELKITAMRLKGAQTG
ncbi:MAG: hypothetical protein DRI90_26600 [Deltaproteobacteria bacterium]|nr:MAG: hypothetical protein DRI90_26600 [Deltaproteobacteria bacterium]